MITIETDRLLLRNYKVTDFEDILKYFSDEEVSKFEDFYPMSEEQVRNIIAEWKDMDNRLVAELKIKQKVIGSVGYWIDDEGHYCIDYDFNLDKARFNTSNISLATRNTWSWNHVMLDGNT